MNSKSGLHLDNDATVVEGAFAANKPGLKSSQQRSTTAAYIGKGKFRLFGHYVHGQFLFLALVEMLVLACTNYLVYTALIPAQLAYGYSWQSAAIVGSSVSLTIIMGMAFAGLYDTRQRETFSGLSLRIGLVFLVAYGIVAALSAYSDLMPVNKSYGVIVLLCSLSGVVVTRILFYKYLDGKILRRKIMVLGVGEKAGYIDRIRRKSDKRGFELAGFVASNGCQKISVDSQKVLHIGDSICSYAFDNGIDEIVVALDETQESVSEEELLECRMHGIQVVDIADFFERERTILHLDLIQPDWLIFGDGFNRGYGASIVKRCLDVIVSVLLLLLTSPIILLTTLAILLEGRGKGSILYKQERVGRGGKRFFVYKFRSMITNAEDDGVPRWAQKSDARITKVGEFIRNYRIDELPQLWNVLKGDMSLVGPRPERPQFVKQLSKINSFYNSRHNVDPGITGWAQLCYPYGSSEQDSIQKLQYDLYYVKNRGLFLDLYILAQTVETVLFKKGAR